MNSQSPQFTGDLESVNKVVLPEDYQELDFTIATMKTALRNFSEELAIPAYWGLLVYDHQLLGFRHGGIWAGFKDPEKYNDDRQKDCISLQMHRWPATKGVSNNILRWFTQRNSASYFSEAGYELFRLPAKTVDEGDGKALGLWMDGVFFLTAKRKCFRKDIANLMGNRYALKEKEYASLEKRLHLFPEEDMRFFRGWAISHNGLLRGILYCFSNESSILWNQRIERYVNESLAIMGKNIWESLFYRFQENLTLDIVSNRRLPINSALFLKHVQALFNVWEGVVIDRSCLIRARASVQQDEESDCHYLNCDWKIPCEGSVAGEKWVTSESVDLVEDVWDANSDDEFKMSDVESVNTKIILATSVKERSSLFQESESSFVPLRVSFPLQDELVSLLMWKGRKYRRKYLLHLKEEIGRAIRSYQRAIELQTEVIKRESEARKAAVGGVLSRNLSHNIGSHVLSRLSQPVDFLSDLNKVYQDECEKKDGATEALFGEPARMNRYLKRRMDFLADSLFSQAHSLSIKDITKDVIGPFLKTKHLNNRISGTKLTNISIDIKNDAKVSTAFPNDILGIQAFYILLENIIRNAAKHQKIESDCIKIDIVVERDSKHSGLISVTLVDCSTPWTSELEEARNRDISLPVLGENGKLRRKAWGMLEMKLACAYLRGILLERIDESFEPPLLTAEEKDNFLSYKLHLTEPKRALFVGAWKDIEPERRKKCETDGIYFCKLEEAKAEAPHHHEFLVFEKPRDELTRLSKEEMARFPQRVVRLSSQSFVESDSSSSLMKVLWKERLAILNLASPVRFEKWVNGTIRCQLQLDMDGSAQQPAVVGRFDSHGEATPDKCLHYEPYGAGTTPLLQQLIASDIWYNESDLQWYAMVEALFARIVIIDERIQEESEKMRSMARKEQQSVREIIDGMNIYIPSSECIDLKKNKLNEDEDGVQIRRYVNQYLTKDGKLNILVIHLGIVERLIGTDPDKVKGWLEDTKGDAHHLIIISGRGTATALPSEYPFLPHSVVEHYVLDNRSKFHLTQALLGARGGQNDA